MSRLRRVRAVAGAVGLAAVLWTITALAVLLISFAPLLALGALHIAVAAVLIPALTRNTAQSALRTAGETA